MALPSLISRCLTIISQYRFYYTKSARYGNVLLDIDHAARANKRRTGMTELSFQRVIHLERNARRKHSLLKEPSDLLMFDIMIFTGRID